MRKTIVGVMGPGKGATAEDVATAHELGKLIAKEGWVLLSGGRNEGVMDAVNKGAKEAGGLTLGILPTSEPASFCEAVDIVVITEMKGARNNINVLSSDVIIACGIGAGTASEISLALKLGKKVIMVNQDSTTLSFFHKIGGEKVVEAEGAEEAVEKAREMLKA